MARDALLLVLGYLMLVAPPDLLSNTFGNLGFAKEVECRKRRFPHL